MLAPEVEAGSSQLLALTVPQAIQLQELFAEIEADAYLNSVKQKLLSNVEVKQGFSVANDKVFYKGRLMIPANSAFILVLLKEYHDTKLGAILEFCVR